MVLTLQALDNHSIHSFMNDASIGRWRGKSDFLLEDDNKQTKASRIHARFEKRSGGQWWVVDCGSSNGTFVNAQRIVGQGFALRSGDMLGFGTYPRSDDKEDGMPRFHYVVVDSACPARETCENDSLVCHILSSSSSEELAAAGAVCQLWRSQAGIVERLKLTTTGSDCITPAGSPHNFYHVCPVYCWQQRYGDVRRAFVTDAMLSAVVMRGFRPCAGSPSAVSLDPDGTVTAVSIARGADNTVLISLPELLSLFPSHAEAVLRLESFRVQCAHRLLDQTDGLWAGGMLAMCSPRLRMMVGSCYEA